MILPGCQTINSASSSKFYHLALLVVLVSCSSNFQHWPLLALFVALVLHKGDSADFIFAILYMIIEKIRLEYLGVHLSWDTLLTLETQDNDCLNIITDKIFDQINKQIPGWYLNRRGFRLLCQNKKTASTLRLYRGQN